METMHHDSREGLIQVTLAHVLWGILPLYWSMLSHLPSLEVMMNRMMWTAIFCSGYFLLRRKNPIRIVKTVLKTRNTLLLITSALLLAVNWVAFLYTVATGHILQASMAYFISPLLLVLFALIFFREKMKRIQSIALFLCLTGVLFAAIIGGEIPYLSLLIALTFAAYTICKKALHLDGVQALLMDGVLMFPVSFGYNLYLILTGESSYLTSGIPVDFLLIFSGVVTLVPLAMYISGNMSVSATSVGFLQFILPIMAFLLGLFVFKEPFRASDGITFAFILGGVLLYLVSLKCKGGAERIPLSPPR